MFTLKGVLGLSLCCVLLVRGAIRDLKSPNSDILVDFLVAFLDFTAADDMFFKIVTSHSKKNEYKLLMNEVWNKISHKKFFHPRRDDNSGLVLNIAIADSIEHLR